MTLKPDEETISRPYFKQEIFLREQTYSLALLYFFIGRETRLML